MISPVLAQGFKSYEKEKAAQLEDLFFPFSSLSGAIMCSPEHLNTIPATTKNNMIWSNLADSNFKSAHSAVIKPTS